MLAGIHQATAQGTTAFTYQGQLHDGGTNANGAYTMIFKLYDAATSGNQIGSTLTTNPTLANGLFTVDLDFGGVFNGSARWLDITVTNGGTTQELSPRVPVLPTPYAQFAAVAATVTNGAIMNAQLAGNAVTDAKIVSVSGSKVSGTVASASFATNALTATNLASGDWVSSVGTFESVPDILGFSENGILAVGLSTNGILLNGGSISGDGHGGVSMNGITTYGSIHFLNNADITIIGDGHGDLSLNGGIVSSSTISAQSFNTTSDRFAKENFKPIDGQEVLDRVASLPISNWNFKSDAATRHIGPMAQDFYAAFNVGPG